MPIAIVTDSTACLPAELAAGDDLTVIPLIVAIDGTAGREGIEITSGDVARALASRRVSVTTSRPAPGEFAEAYQRLFDRGADGIISVHLSAKLSGTYDSARLAAREYPGRVEVVDSRGTGMALGFPALAARGAGGLAEAGAAVRAAIARTSALFFVDSLEHLRRGGRIGAASALLGTALSVKPILYMDDGEIVVRDRVRTAGRALSRLVDLAVDSAGSGPVDVAIHHLAASGPATWLSQRLGERLGERLVACYQTEIGAAVAAHVGPGLVSVVVHSRSTG